MKIQQLAQQALDQFENKTKSINPDERFWCLKDHPLENNPNQWVFDLVQECHKIDNVLPNDYIYQYIVDALQLMADACVDEIEEIHDLIYQIEPDVYNHDLLEWVSNNNVFANWCDEILETNNNLTFFQVLSQAQQLQRQRIAQCVLDCLIEREKESEGV